jgi:hypothetical protein
MRYRTPFLFALCVVTVVPFAVAHEDQMASLAKADKTYIASKPLGSIRVVYTVATAAAKASLSIKSDMFDVTVPEAGLADLPRPDWDHFDIAYSLTSIANGKWVERPYAYLLLRLYGPAGQNWEQTWAIFHVDADGKLTRQIKRFVPDPKSNSIRVIWKDWPIGGTATAAEILETAGQAKE